MPDIHETLSAAAEALPPHPLILSGDMDNNTSVKFGMVCTWRSAQGKYPSEVHFLTDGSFNNNNFGTDIIHCASTGELKTCEDLIHIADVARGIVA